VPDLVTPKNLHFNGKNLWFAFYNLLAVPVMFLFFRFAAVLPFRSRRLEKIKAGVAGRKNLFAGLSAQLQRCGSGPRIWIHASSMGECEQARPILRELQERLPHSVRVLTLFSPSAHVHLSRQNLPAEVLSYLPFDSRSNVRRFLDLVQPAAGIFIRHDLWPNFLWQARQRGVKLLLADASVSANAKSFRHKPGVRNFNREVFANFDWICAVSGVAAENLRDLIRHPERLLRTGDTRYDQVVFRARAGNISQLLPEAWQTHTHIFVAGSTWPSDEEVLIPAFAATRSRIPEARMILAPHEPTAEHLQSVEKSLKTHRLTSCRLSQAFSQPAQAVVLVDRVGVLAELYGAGSVAFVGGSFGPGVHSVLEAAAHGLPVLFGPAMRNSAEAMEMEQLGLGKILREHTEGAQILMELFEAPARANAWGKKCRAFVEQKTGAARSIVTLLEAI